MFVTEGELALSEFSAPAGPNMFLTCVNIYMYIYIYTYKERGRERERERYTYLLTYIHK